MKKLINLLNYLKILEVCLKFLRKKEIRIKKIKIKKSIIKNNPKS